MMCCTVQPHRRDERPNGQTGPHGTHTTAERAAADPARRGGLSWWDLGPVHERINLLGQALPRQVAHWP